VALAADKSKSLNLAFENDDDNRILLDLGESSASQRCLRHSDTVRRSLKMRERERERKGK
jgi:hypothetical protein